jgi:hypothetical protein
MMIDTFFGRQPGCNMRAKRAMLHVMINRSFFESFFTTVIFRELRIFDNDVITRLCGVENGEKIE